MARTSKYCIFCGGHPSTREHIWADWLAQYIPKTMPKHSSASSIVNADRSVSKTSRLWGGDPRSRRLQIVCQPCNNHWMSDLQTAAKPILIPLIAGRTKKSLALRLEQQTILAAWAAMFVICAEYFYPTRAAISVTDRRWLYNTKTAPNDFRIWIGDYERKEWVPHWGHCSLRISAHEGEQGWAVHPDGTPRSNTQTTTFVVGRLFVHAYSCPFPEILHADKIVSFVDSKLVQIWPPRHSFLLWPPAAISDRDADGLASAIFDRLDEAGIASDSAHTERR
jgi:hypothetical protein